MVKRHMREHISMGRTAVEQCGWDIPASQDTMQRKAYLLACERWDEYQLSLQEAADDDKIGTGRASFDEPRRSRSFTRRGRKVSDASLVFQQNLPTIPDTVSVRRGQNGKNGQSNRETRSPLPLGELYLRRSISQPRHSPAPDIDESLARPRNDPIPAIVASATLPSLSRTLRVFVAWKG